MPLHAETLLFADIAIRTAFVVIFAANVHKRRKQTYLLKWFASPAFAMAALIGIAMLPGSPLVAASQGALVAGLLGVSFSLCWSGLRDLLGNTKGFLPIVALGLVPGVVYGLFETLGEPRWALVGALGCLAALAARPILDLAPAFLRDRQPSQLFVLMALTFYATAFGGVGLQVGFDAGAGHGDIAVPALAADCFFSILLLVNFLAITGEQARRSLRDLATTDTLTGLLNRRGFLKVAEKALARRAGRAQAGCVVMADIDHFKAINDRLGHDSGDVVLAEFARRCRSVIQRPGDLIARWGGEEFVVLLPNTTAVEAVVCAEKIRQAVAAKPFKVYGGSCAVTVSAGVAWLKAEEINVELGIGRADVALYRAKHEGRDRICLAKEPERPASGRPANDCAQPLQDIAETDVTLVPAAMMSPAVAR